MHRRLYAVLALSCIKKGPAFVDPFWLWYLHFPLLFRSYLWIFMEIVLCFLEVVDFFYIHTKATCFIGSNREKCWAASRPLCPERNNPWIPCPNGAPPTSSADSVCSGGSQVFSSTTLEATHILLYLMGRTESPTDFAKISGNRREFWFVDSRFLWFIKPFNLEFEILFYQVFLID